MKKFAMGGLAAILGMVAMAGAAMAHHAEVDVLAMDLQTDVGMYQLVMTPDGDGLLMLADAMVEADVLAMDLQTDVGMYQLVMTPDGDGLLMLADAMVEADVVPDGVAAASIQTFQTVSLKQPLEVRGDASNQLVDDAMRLWRVRTADAYTLSPDLLIKVWAVD